MKHVFIALFITVFLISTPAKAACYPSEIIDIVLAEANLFPTIIMDAGHYWLVLYEGGWKVDGQWLYSLVAVSPEFSCIISAGFIGPRKEIRI